MQPKKRGGVLLGIGLALVFLVAPSAFALGFGIGIANAEPRASVVEPGGTFRASPYDTLTIYSSADSAPTCMVEAPDGHTVQVDSEYAADTVVHDGQTYEDVGDFDVPSGVSRDYTLTCGDRPALVRWNVDEPFARGAHYLGVAMTAGLIAGGCTALVGGGMAFVGAVRLSRSKQERRAWELQRYAAWQAGVPLPTDWSPPPAPKVVNPPDDPYRGPQ